MRSCRQRRRLTLLRLAMLRRRLLGIFVGSLHSVELVLGLAFGHQRGWVKGADSDGVDINKRKNKAGV
jgi:hypothetical protein